jgi:hypothetical protein
MGAWSHVYMRAPSLYPRISNVKNTMFLICDGRYTYGTSRLGQPEPFAEFSIPLNSLRDEVEKPFP